MKAKILNEGASVVLCGIPYVVMFDEELSENQLVMVFNDETGLHCMCPHTSSTYRIDRDYEKAAIIAIEAAQKQQ